MYFYLCDYIQISNKAIGVLAHTCMHARMCVCVFESLIPILQARRLLILSFLKLYVLWNIFTFAIPFGRIFKIIF